MISNLNYSKTIDDAFNKAFEVGLFTKDQPYMYMGEDENIIYFKHKVTRDYLNLIKEG
tara:strand:+ start:145 stop:318 length:174 start_codon:yes stop_codon:yes gene_type:complete